MTAAVDLAVLAVVVGVHTLAAAVLTRLLRVRLSSRWSPLIFAALVVPVVLVASTMVVTGALGLGPDLGSPGTVLFVLVALPAVIGATVDYVWMPPPASVEHPDRA